MLRAPRHNAWIHVAMALCRMGPEARAEASSTVPALIETLATDKWAPNRRFAAEVLAEIGPAAQQAISALSTATYDSDPHVRRAAQNALTIAEGSPIPDRLDTLRKP